MVAPTAVCRGDDEGTPIHISAHSNLQDHAISTNVIIIITDGKFTFPLMFLNKQLSGTSCGRCAFKKLTMSSQSTILNDWSVFRFYQIGADVIPANTKEKHTFESWSKCQDRSISDEIYKFRKKSRYSNKDIEIIITEDLAWSSWREIFSSIDLDNKKTIEEFCNVEFEYLKQPCLIEQTSNLDNAHIYFIVEMEIPNNKKGSHRHFL